MCRPTAEAAATKPEKMVDSSSNDETTKKEKPPLPKVHWTRFFDPQEPWLLVPSGSYGGYFDYIPANFRVGPWNIACCMYLVVIVYWISLQCVQCYSNFENDRNSQDIYNHHHHSDSNAKLYYEVNTWQWWYNAFGFVWTTYVAYRVAASPNGIYTWIMYTLQSWTLIQVRHLLAVLVPFFPSLVGLSESLRFAMLIQTSIVFFFWNFVLLPAMAIAMKNPKHRQDFLKFCFSFNLVQLHIFNLPLAVVNGIWGSPGRSLGQVDFVVALVLLLQYLLMYLCVLDRLGIHLYFIFSPRSPLALLTWTAALGAYQAGYSLWTSLILKYSSG